MFSLTVSKAGELPDEALVIEARDAMKLYYEQQLAITGLRERMRELTQQVVLAEARKRGFVAGALGLDLGCEDCPFEDQELRDAWWEGVQMGDSQAWVEAMEIPNLLLDD